MVDHPEEGLLPTALFWRVSSRGGRKKAALAVAHRMLSISWHIIGEGKTYQEIGANYQKRQHPGRSARRLIRRLEQLGFNVDAKRAVPAATWPGNAKRGARTDLRYAGRPT